MMMSRNYHVIGAGGVGSWLLPALVKLAKPQDNIYLWDGDTLEPKNMDRQLFSPSDIGSNKAEALMRKYAQEAACSLYAKNEYFTCSKVDLSDYDKDEVVLFGCADNHPSRAEILYVCDRDGVCSIIGGNGYTDADGYYYDASYEGTPCDPRVYYPEILTDRTGSPVHADGCTGEAQKETPQLVLANMWAAAHMLHLLWYHVLGGIAESLPEDMKEHMPMLSRNSAYMFETVKKGDLDKNKEARTLD